MTDEERSKVPLMVRLRGPGVREGRLLLADLAQLGRQLQMAVDRVARVLAGEASLRPGRRPEELRSACALEVVASGEGSFELRLGLRHEQAGLPGLDLGEEALEKMVAGLDLLVGPGEPLPAGYDLGVLAAWRETLSLFNHGIEAIELHLRTARHERRAIYDAYVHRRVVERMREPVRNLRAVEGRLLMVDFRELGFRCRVHPSAGAPVDCVFDERLAESVYDNLRSLVRVTGEAEEDPETHRIRRLRLRDVEPVAVETRTGLLDAEEFWREPTLDDLASEQGMACAQRLEDLVGAAADLWSSDEEFDRFVEDIRDRRRESLRREHGGR